MIDPTCPNCAGLTAGCGRPIDAATGRHPLFPNLFAPASPPAALSPMGHILHDAPLLREAIDKQTAAIERQTAVLERIAEQLIEGRR